MISDQQPSNTQTNTNRHAPLSLSCNRASPLAVHHLYPFSHGASLSQERRSARSPHGLPNSHHSLMWDQHCGAPCIALFCGRYIANTI